MRWGERWQEPNGTKLGRRREGNANTHRGDERSPLFRFSGSRRQWTVRPFDCLRRCLLIAVTCFAALADGRVGAPLRGYPLPLFRAATGLSAWAMRKARRNGLRIVKVGRRHFVRGSDWDRFLEQQTDSQSTD